MDPILVDVNVHPSKLEVRLSKETELHDLIRDGIKDVFKQQQLIPSAQLPKKSAPVIKNEQQFITFDEKPAEKKVPEKSTAPSYSPMKLSSVVKEPVDAEEELPPLQFDAPPIVDQEQTLEVSDVSAEEPETFEQECHEEEQQPASERVPIMYRSARCTGLIYWHKTKTACILSTSTPPKNVLNMSTSVKRWGRLSLRCRR